MFIKQNNFEKRKKSKKTCDFYFFKLSTIMILFILLIYLRIKSKKTPIKGDILKNSKNIYKINYSYMNNTDSKCIDLDPINMINNTLNNNPQVICQYEKSTHICYPNTYFNMFEKEGILCKMENIILDPSKWSSRGAIYKGPINESMGHIPLLSQGFFNMKCKNLFKIKTNRKYEKYLESWNYDYNDNLDNEEELAEGKTIFFISRTSDSLNMYHGISEVINAMALMYLFNLSPEDIKIVLLESFEIEKDPYYDIYKNVISRGEEIVHIKNLKKKYHITSGILIPTNMDSPCFILDIPPHCKYPTLTFQLLNILIEKYMNLEEFKDQFINIDKIFYYPNSTLNNHNLGKKFVKSVTIIWRNVWPEGRKGQGRIFANAKETADSLSLALPDDILVRLVDTAKLTISQQIALMRKTDYLTGIHGAAFALSIFTPNHCIIHEFLTRNHYVQQIQSLSGHKFYSSYIYHEKKTIDDNENIFLNCQKFTEQIMNIMKHNNFIDI